ncbi:MAG: ABC transporter ATP-binding protein [Alphaproteobacteria bacterium]
MTGLLEVSDLSVTFHGGGTPVQAVDTVSFTMAPGETLALVGESGSGKSTVALALSGLLPASARTRARRLALEGRDHAHADEETLRRLRGARIGMIFQEPMTALNPLHGIGRQIGEPLRVHRGLSRAQIRTRVIERLERVGLGALTRRLDALPHQLSGGQRQRVMIAMALAGEPDLLVADEPTTALDVTVQAQILTLLKDLKAQLGMGLLLITHDLGVVRHMADRVCVMKDGRIVETGTTQALFSEPEHPYTRMLIAAQPRPLAPRPIPEQDPVLEARDLSIHFPVRQGLFRRQTDVVKAVDAVSLSLRPGRTLAVVGESGSGKTTLAMGLLRLERPTSGTVRLDGSPIEALSASALRPRRRDLQIVFQDPFGALSPRLSVAGIIGEGLNVHGLMKARADRRKAIAAVLEEVGLPADAMDRFPHEFSGGQRQRIAIARALILRPRVLILDEPTSALDRSVQIQIIDLLMDLQARYGLAYLFISHDLSVVRALADDVLVMRHGRIVEQGPATQVFTAPTTDYARDLIGAALALALPVQ